MEYIKSYEYRKQYKINEGIFSALKDKIVMAISKKIGGAKKIDTLILNHVTESEILLEKEMKFEGDVIKAKNAWEAAPDNAQLKTAYELKQKSTKAQSDALRKQIDAKDKIFKLTMQKIVGKDNPNLSLYSEMEIANMEAQLADFQFKLAEQLGFEAEKIKELQDSIKTKEAEALAKKNVLKAELMAKGEEEQGAEQTSHLDDIKVGSKFKYFNSMKKMINVTVVDLLKTDKVKSQNGTMVMVKSTGEPFRVPKKSLKPLKDEVAPVQPNTKATKDGNTITSPAKVKSKPAAVAPVA